MPKIMIVDDDATIQMELEEYLTHKDYTVVGTADTGEGAIEMARETDPDLILMDVNLSGEMDGISAAQEIKEEMDVAVVFITGFGDPEYIERAKRVEPFGYVMKPFDEREINGVIEIALYKKEMELKLRKANEHLEQTNRDLKQEIKERERTKEALRESEKLYRDIFEKNNAIKWVIDPSSGEIVDANPAACEFYQYSHEEITKLHVWDINILGEADLKKLVASAESDEKTEFTFQHRLASGEIRHVQVYTGNLETGGKKLLHSIIIDITDRKEAQEALQESEARHRELVENAILGIFQVTKEGQFMMSNQRMAKIFGYDSQQDFFSDVDNIIELYVNPEERSKVLQEIDEKGHIDGKEMSFKRKNGGPIFCNAYVRSIQRENGKYIYEGLLEDITDKKNMEAQLQQAIKMKSS